MKMCLNNFTHEFLRILVEIYPTADNILFYPE